MTLQLGQLRREILAEVDQPRLLHRLKQQFPLAHQGHDGRTAYQVVARERQPAHHGQPPLVQEVVVLIQRLGVLAVGCPHTANGRYAQTDQIAVRLRAVALEVAVQAALALGHGQCVGGQRKVVHAHVHIPSIHESIERARQHGELARARGQLRRDDATLRLETLWQVRIGIQRDAVGPQLRHLGQRAVKRLGRLARQAVDQIHIH